MTPSHQNHQEHLGQTILEDSRLQNAQRPPFFLNSIFHHSGQVDSVDVATDPWTWSSDHIQKCWELFKQNVDPVVRVLHKPSMEALVQNAAVAGISGLKPESAALMVAICYAAVITLHPAHIAQHFTEDPNLLHYRHQHAIDLAMARANWFHSNHIQVMQALAIVLVSKYFSGHIENHFLIRYRAVCHMKMIAHCGCILVWLYGWQRVWGFTAVLQQSPKLARFRPTCGHGSGGRYAWWM